MHWLLDSFVNIVIKLFFDPFVLNVAFLHSLKTSESLTVFWCFQRVEKGCTGSKWVEYSYLCSLGDSGISHNSANDEDMDILKISTIRSEASQLSNTANHTGKIDQINDNARRTEKFVFLLHKISQVESWDISIVSK